MAIQTPESENHNAFVTLSNKVISLLDGAEPHVSEWRSKDPLNMRFSSNGIIRSIQYNLAPRHHHKVISKVVNVRTREGYEGFRLADTTTYLDDEISGSGVGITGYYVHDQGSFLMARAVWEAPITPENLTEEEATAIAGCMDGNLSNIEAAKTSLQRFIVDHNM